MEFGSRRPVGAKSIEQVVAALREAGKPMTISQIAKACGKSYPTVKFALQHINAKPVPETYPQQWLPPEGEVVIPLGTRAPAKAQSDRVTIRLRTDITPGRWNASSERIGNQIRVIKIERTSSPRELQEQFMRAASMFATMAHNIELVRDRPDWFDLLEDDS